MKLLIRYLKPFLFGVLLAVVFLFIQVRMDLSLPNYMSDIINTGIQKSGITESAPKAMSSKAYQLMVLFMNEQDKKEVESNYKLIQKGDSAYKEEYPYVQEENIYVIKKGNKLSSLDSIFGRAVATMISFSKAQSKSDSMSSTTGGGLSKIYPMLPVLERLPSSAFDAARKDASKMDPSISLQMANSLTKQMYEELGVNVSSIQTNYIIQQGIWMLLVALAGGFSSIVVSLIAARIAASVSKNIRKDVFGKVVSFTNHEFDEFGSSSLLTRTTNDITQIQMLIFMGIRMVIYAPMMGIGGVFMALEKSTSMSWIIALAVTLLIGFVAIIFVFAIPKFKLMQTLIDRLNLVAKENLSGLLVIRAFGSEPFEEKRFAKANKKLADNTLFIGRIMSSLMPIITLIMSGTTLLIVWVGAHQIAESNLLIGDMMAFMQYAMQIVMSFLMIAMMFIFIPRAAVSIKRVDEVFNMEVSIQDPKVEEEFKVDKTGYVEFKNVCFKYKNAEECVLKNISFTAKPGQTTAFIGSTGSGKSTLINLIPRFYDVTEGAILVNGVDVRNVSGYKLREKIGYIPQKGLLLSGTILSNLNYGKKDASMDEIKEASEVAQASEFINNLKEEYDAPIAQGGSNVSGGQKQRLSIARALVKKPDIYIFDDSFSALDYKTDAKLRGALKSYTKNGTVLIVAQRVGTIMNADQIIVLDQGEIVGIGKHHDLLKSCPTYFEIASSQLSKEEL